MVLKEDFLNILANAWYDEEKEINQVDCEWYIAYFSEASLDNYCAFIINYIQTFYQRIAS
jgi:hypothetical protein